MLLMKCFVITLLFWTQCASDSRRTSLELLHVFFRHGDRTPDKKDFYPGDPYKNDDFYPMGLGQLSNPGKMRVFELGKMLRRNYNEFLGPIYVPDVLEASSSDYTRTKMSLLLVLAGLWPPGAPQAWNPDLPWQPVPYNYKPSEYDYFIRRPNFYCPKYLEELEKLLNSSVAQKYMQDNEATIKYIENYSQKKITKPIDLFNIYQNLNSEENLNLSLPKWTSVVYPEPLQSYASTQCLFENYSDILKRLNGGRSLKAVLENSRAKMQGSSGKKIYLFSGHENNIVNMLATLNLFKPHVPVYGSAIIVELLRVLDSSAYEMRVLYYQPNTTAAKSLTLKGCTEYCPFETFEKLTQFMIPINYTAECESEKLLD